MENNQMDYIDLMDMNREKTTDMNGRFMKFNELLNIPLIIHGILTGYIIICIAQKN